MKINQMQRRLSLWSPAILAGLAGAAASMAAGPFGAAIELDELNGDNGFALRGIGTGDISGRVVSCVGDINADGIEDFCIGAHPASEAYVIFGGAQAGAEGTMELSNLDGANGFVLRGPPPAGRFGFSVAAAGDINLDGIDDLIVGADRSCKGGTDRGAVYVFFGAPQIGAGGIVSTASIDGTNGFAIHGYRDYGQIGRAVACAGDFNNDGVDDILIGAPSLEPPPYLSQFGTIFVVYGAEGIGESGIEDISDLDGVNGVAITGIDFVFDLGRSVSAAGDTNGDGIDDILVGMGPIGPSLRPGHAAVVFGGSKQAKSGVIDLRILDGDDGFVIHGFQSADNSGTDVAFAGDLNGDGFDDLAIGSSSSSIDEQGRTRKASILFGRPGVGATGAVELADLNGLNGFVCLGEDRSDFSGGEVAPAGDINKDGIDDLLIGAWIGNPSGAYAAGITYVIFGGPDVGTGGAVLIDRLNGEDGFVCNGINVEDQSGRAVDGVGDVNDDGIDDFLIGAFAADPNGFISGESYIIFGRCAPPADLNADCDVNTTDLAILIDQFGTPGPAADLNNDGVVDTADLGALIGSFGQ